MDRRSFLQGAVLTAGAAVVGRSAQAAPEWGQSFKDGMLTLSYGGQPLLAYQHHTAQPPSGVSPLYARSGYLCSVYAPNGALVTEDFPADHLHQRGLFFAWTNTVVGDLKPDFWNLGSGTGRIRSTKAEAKTTTGQPAHLEMVHLWEMKRGQEWVPALDEEWSVQVLPPSFNDPKDPQAAFVIDLISRQTPRVDIELVKHLYGGMAVRGSGEWSSERKEVLRVLTSEGKDRAAANASRAKWIDMSGPIGEQTAGVALLEHPSVLRAPNPLRMHPDMPYYAFAFPQEQPFRLQAGKTYEFRYRVVAHNGLANAASLNRLWERFARGE